MRIALISFLTNSLNTRSLSSYLKSNGVEVICLFCQGVFNEKNLEKLIDIMMEKDISLAGISLVTDDYSNAVLVTSTIKERMKVPVIWGGAHVNVKPEESLKHADMVCLGEGEEAILELVNMLKSNSEIQTTINNIWFNHNGTIIRNELRQLEEDLDKYPYPDFDLESQFVMTESGFVHLSEEHLNGEYGIMTSRGCPYACTYCYNNYRRKHYHGKGRYLRMRSIQGVTEELVIARNIFPNLKRINFWDDSFVSRKYSDFELFKQLYVKQVQLPFFALIEPMAFNFDKIKLLRDCGLQSLQIGIQTGSERVNREVYRRNVTNEKVLEMAKLINSLNIGVKYDLIFNNPYETKDDLIETIHLLLKFPKPFILQGYNLIFYPGTEMTNQALLDGYISENENEEDYSTIESYLNSPIAMKGDAAISERFYKIGYSSKEKKYYNTLISLITRRVPGWFIIAFTHNEASVSRILLRILVILYSAAVRTKKVIFRK